MILLKPEQIERIEREFPKGISASHILGIFQPLGVQLSEATFRKYVQAGLLPRSKRVGRKGKHQGSMGLYPVTAVRRINAIKQMMVEGHTLEEIKRSFVFVRENVAQVERELDGLLDGFAAELGHRSVDGESRGELQKQLELLRRRAQDLVRDAARLGSAVSAQASKVLEP